MNFYRIIIFIILIIISISLFWKSGFLNIKKIEIEKYNVLCLDDQKLLSEFKIKDENILFINEDNLNKKILLKYICIKNISFEKQFPDKIKLIINGRKGLANISIYQNKALIDLKILEATASSEAALIDWSINPLLENENFIINDEGIIFAKQDKNNLPFLYIPNQILEIGRKINDINFRNVLSVFTRLPQMNINFTQSKLNEHNLQVLSEPKIIFSLEKDVLKQLTSLHLILEKAKIDNKNMEIIDLRFDKPVVKYLPIKK